MARIRVLLVDEDDEARASLAGRLARLQSVELTGAANGPAEAAQLLEQLHPDLVLLDVHRRDGRELELCHAIGGLTSVPIITLMSYVTLERWNAVRAAGATAYTLKQVDTAQLEAELAGIARHTGRPAGAEGGSQRS